MLDSFGFFDGHILGFADGNGTKVQVMNLKEGFGHLVESSEGGMYVYV